MLFETTATPTKPQKLSADPPVLGALESPDYGASHFGVQAHLPNMLHVEVGGFFVDDKIEALRLTLAATLRTLTCKPNQHVTLCDIRAMKIQAQDAVSAFSDLVNDPGLRSRRLAFVTATSLARVQARRLTDRPGVGFFADAATAKAWLFEAD